MPNNELKAKVKADISDFNKKMDEVGASAKSAAKIVVSAIAAATAATAALGLESIKTAAEYQNLEKRLQGVFGDKGKEIFKGVAESAQSSALETRGLTEAFIRFSALRGLEPQIKTIEAIGFAAKILHKDIGFITEQFARMFNQLERGAKVDKDIRDQLVGAFGKDGKEFMTRVAAGTVTAAEALELLNKRGLELGKIFETGLDTEISKLSGSWDSLLLALGSGENLESVEALVTSLTEQMSKLGESDSIRGIADSMNQMLTAITSEDIENILSTIATIVSVIAKVSAHIAKYWKLYQILIIPVVAALATIKIIQTAILFNMTRQLAASKEHLAQMPAAIRGLRSRLATQKAITNEVIKRKRLTRQARGSGMMALTDPTNQPALDNHNARERLRHGVRGMGVAAGGKKPFLPAGTSKLGAGMEIAAVAVIGYELGKWIGDGIADTMDEIDPKALGKPEGEELRRMRQTVIDARRGAMSEEAHKRWVANLPPGPKLS